MTTHSSSYFPMRFRGEIPREFATLPRLLRKNAADWPSSVAIRQKKLGIWHETTWCEALDQARSLCLGLAARGIGQGDVVALIGQNRPHWFLSEIAIHALSGLSLGIYKDSLADEVAYLLALADVRLVITEDEEQADKILSICDRLPCLEWIVVNDLRGMTKYNDRRLLALQELVADGEAINTSDPQRFDRIVDATDPDADAILCTTSGTTAHPKLVILRSGPFLNHALAFLETDPKYPEDDYVSVLPLPWIGEQVYAVAHILIAGIKINFVEEEETQTQDMREIAPTCLLFPPRVWENLAADIRARMLDSTAFKRAVYRFGMSLARKAEAQGRQSWMADLLVGRKLRDWLGMARLRSAATGGAPLGPEVFRFFRSIGVPLRQLYGQTEMAGVYCGHLQADVDFTTVGKMFRNVEIRIDEPDRNGLGHVLARHPGMFVGYYGNATATTESLKDGWMHTGDAGYFDDKGHLVVVDRVSDLATLSTSDRFSPLFIENKLKFSPYVSECVVFGEGRPHITAIICIRFTIVSKWAEARRIAFTSYSDLSSRRETRELISAEIEEVNKTLPPRQQIKRFLLLYKELDADDGELTRTRKVRRGVVNERYKFLIDALYDGSTEVPVDTTITLQDGRQQRLRTRVSIEALYPVTAERMPQPKLAATG